MGNEKVVAIPTAAMTLGTTTVQHVQKLLLLGIARIIRKVPS